MTFLTWEQAVGLTEAQQESYRALIYLAIDPGMRWNELIGLRRARVDLGQHKVRLTVAAVEVLQGSARPLARKGRRPT